MTTSYIFGMYSHTESVSDSYSYLSEQSKFIGAVNSTVTNFETAFWDPFHFPGLVELDDAPKSKLDQLS